jgi:hypothetical protein
VALFGLLGDAVSIEAHLTRPVALATAGRSIIRQSALVE